jgi:acetyl-CoA/propionyl-CoA carboxylase biotin carboxyl carrier protein
VHTRWIETEFATEIPPYDGPSAAAEVAAERQRITVEVDGRRLEVVLPEGLAPAGNSARRPAPPRRSSGNPGAAASGDDLTAPMQGTIVKVAVSDGDRVEAGDLVVVLEAMKMEQPLTAHKAGVVGGLSAAAGDAVDAGAVLCSITDG